MSFTCKRTTQTGANVSISPPPLPSSFRFLYLIMNGIRFNKMFIFFSLQSLQLDRARLHLVWFCVRGLPLIRVAAMSFFAPLISHLPIPSRYSPSELHLLGSLPHFCCHYCRQLVRQRFSQRPEQQKEQEHQTLRPRRSHLRPVPRIYSASFLFGSSPNLSVSARNEAAVQIDGIVLTWQPSACCFTSLRRPKKTTSATRFRYLVPCEAACPRLSLESTSVVNLKAFLPTAPRLRGQPATAVRSLKARDLAAPSTDAGPAIGSS